MFLVYIQQKRASTMKQKQPSIGVLIKRCSENIQQIYRKAPLSKCNFNKVAFVMGVLLYIFCIFSEQFFLRAPLETDSTKMGESSIHIHFLNTLKKHADNQSVSGTFFVKLLYSITQFISATTHGCFGIVKHSILTNDNYDNWYSYG